MCPCDRHELVYYVSMLVCVCTTSHAACLPDVASATDTCVASAVAALLLQPHTPPCHANDVLPSATAKAVPIASAFQNRSYMLLVVGFGIC